eukprot:9308307-Pyramimonas_sp.AAC.1
MLLGPRIRACGVDARQLSNAPRTELGVNPPLRWQRIVENKQRVDRARGLLALVNGSESCAAVGRGRAAALCRRAGVQGKASQKSLQCRDSDLIDVQNWFQNAH